MELCISVAEYNYTCYLPDFQIHIAFLFMLKIIFTMISYLRNYFPILVVFLSCLISRFWYHFFALSILPFFFANFMYLRNNGCNGANNFFAFSWNNNDIVILLEFSLFMLN